MEVAEELVFVSRCDEGKVVTEGPIAAIILEGAPDVAETGIGDSAMLWKIDKGLAIVSVGVDGKFGTGELIFAVILEDPSDVAEAGSRGSGV